MSFSLKLFGGIALTGEHGPLTGPAVQRHRLALLALLATARSRSVSRDKLLAWLWPERESEPARRLLNQAVHALRQALGAEAIRSAGDDLQLDTSVVRCDVVAFEEALARGEAELAVSLFAGPFLDGFFLDDAPEFERWVDRERALLTDACGRALEEVAEAAERAGQTGGAVERWKARAALDPYDSRVALRLMQALERAGNRAGAIQHATLHQQLLREELEIELPSEIRTLVQRLRRDPAPVPTSEAASGRVDAPAPPRIPESAAPMDAEPATIVDAPRRRTTWYAALVLLLVPAIGGALWLASRKVEPAAAPPGVDAIARAVAQELDRRERGDTASRLARHRTHSIPAYELYLRGDDPALLRSDSGARRGLEYFRQAVALDSNYAAAWAGVARMTFRVSSGRPAELSEVRAQSEMAARRALALDDSLAEAHAMLGVFGGMDSDFEMAEQHFRRALALEPGRTRVREWFAGFLLLTGRRAEALAEAERALALDPLSPSATAEVARALAANDRCDEALARLETIKALDPPLLRAAPIAARCFARQGQWTKAIGVLQPQAVRDSNLAPAMLGYVYGRAGKREAAESIQVQLLERWRGGRSGAVYLAYVPAGLGDRDQAFAWLDSASKDGSLRTLLHRADLTDAPFDVLEQDPRLDRLRMELGIQKR
jgi:DNA-binding SARP family transcriptional activator